jgi:Ca2+-binding RTX toxin-like protein
MSTSSFTALPNSPVLNGNVVLENAVNGTEIGRISVSDPDGDTLRVSIVDAYGNTDLNSPFALVYDPATGTYKLVVRDSSKFDYETTGGTLKVKVKVSDATGSTFRDFTINVADVNEAPTDITLSSYSVNEGAPAGQFVAYLGGTDPDAGDALTYELADAANSPFQIVRNAAGVYILQVRDGSLIDYESDPDKLIDVTVIARDKNGLVVEKTFVLNINDVAGHPTDILIDNDTVLEHHSTDSAIGWLSALGTDAGATYTFSLLNDAQGRFYIDGNILRATDGMLIDYEVQRTHDVVIRVTDQAGNWFDKTFTISVRDLEYEVIDGTAGSERIRSGIFDDVLNGAGGNDTLESGGGNDELTGGSGQDHFVMDWFSYEDNYVDYIYDFEVGIDKVVLDQLFFDALQSGSLALSNFHLGSQPAATSHHIMYDQTTGNLYYDPDGNALGGLYGTKLIATLVNRPTLSVSDFLIVG